MIIFTYMTDIKSILLESREAAASLQMRPDSDIDNLLLLLADRLVESTEDLLAANAADLEAMDKFDPNYDRLQLTPQRIAAIASDMRHVASLPSPRNRILESRTLPNGLCISKHSVPFGVVAVVYEARPNVTFDVASLCLKSGNACVLKGGSDARRTNEAAIRIIHAALLGAGFPEACVMLLTGSHEVATELLRARGLVDLVIPRGGRKLIDAVRANALVPVIETGAGVCHAYFHQDADREMGAKIVHNAKTRRVSVCNALDCLVVHSSRLGDLPDLCEPLGRSGVRIFADGRALQALAHSYPGHLLEAATEESFGTEFRSMAMAIKTVDSLDDAIAHINCFGSGHSESIISSSDEVSARFTMLVDAACVYTNAPTSWTDGAQFGLGAEIGISTQKLHARGPMALNELNTYKWVIRGEGQLRPV